MRASILRWDERAQAPHAAALAFHRELLALRQEVIVPHLASGAHGDGWEVLGETALLVRWRFGDGYRLAVVANLGPQPAQVSYELAGRPVFQLHGVRARLDGGELPPWSAGWFLAVPA